MSRALYNNKNKSITFVPESIWKLSDQEQIDVHKAVNSKADYDILEGETVVWEQTIEKLDSEIGKLEKEKGKIDRWLFMAKVKLLVFKKKVNEDPQ